MKYLKTINELNTGVGSVSPPIGPGEGNTGIRFKPVISGAIGAGSNELEGSLGIGSEVIEDENYFQGKKPKKRKKEKIFKEGSGFGNTDYMDVTGKVGSFGAVDKSPPVGRTSSGILDFRKGTPAIIRFKDYKVDDPYFSGMPKKKRKSKSTYLKRLKDKKTKKLNKVFAGGLKLVVDKKH